MISHTEALKRLEQLRDSAFTMWDYMGGFGALRSDFVLRMVLGLNDKDPLPKNIGEKITQIDPSIVPTRGIECRLVGLFAVDKDVCDCPACLYEIKMLEGLN